VVNSGLRNGWNRRLAGVTFFFLFASAAFSQFYNLPQDIQFDQLTAQRLALKDSSIHSSFRPYIPFFSPVYRHVPDSHNLFPFIKDDPGIDAIFNHDVVKIQPRGGDFTLRLDPLLNLEYGVDLGTPNRQRLYSNTRGFIGSGQVGRFVYFETMLAENQSMLPAWLSDYVSAAQVVPGQGRWKTFKTSGFDYAFASGFVSVQLSKHINVQAGHGKHQIGHGYRSLLWSDNAFNYPYVRISQQWLRGQLQYYQVYAVLMNLVPAAAVVSPNAERLFQKKPAAFHYLSFNPAGWLNIGLFEGVVWQVNDYRNQPHLSWEYFNPVIFGQAATLGLDHTNNVLTGGDIKIKLSDRLNVYAQGMLDGIAPGHANGYGYQAGLNAFDLFGISKLKWQIEFNFAGKDSYRSTDTISDQSWTQYGQNLAFTPGSGSELMTMIDYRRGRWFANVRYHYQQRGDNKPLMRFVNIVNGRAGFIINPSYNLNISIGALYRNQNFSNFIKSNGESGYVFVALRTGLFNIYYDF
jgi:hypothetical protein